jgi:predicted Fe-Mo cluster-binding NifX family protein
MKKVAMPVNGNLLCDYFCKSRTYKIFTIDDNSVSDVETVKTPERDSIKIAEWLLEKNITDVISRRMEHRVSDFFHENKVHVFVGVELKTPAEVIEDFLNKSLVTNGSMLTFIS